MILYKLRLYGLVNFIYFKIYQLCIVRKYFQRLRIVPLLQTIPLIFFFTDLVSRASSSIVSDIAKIACDDEPC